MNIPNQYSSTRPSQFPSPRSSAAATTPTRREPKQPIPSPLPTFRGRLAIPQTLNQSVTTSLSRTSGSVQNIHKAMSDGMDRTGFMKQLADRIEMLVEDSFENGNNEGDILRQLLLEVKAGAGTGTATGVESRSSDKGEDSSTPHAMIGVERSIRENDGQLLLEQAGSGETKGITLDATAMQGIINAVKNELERSCVCVDEAEWVG